MENRKIQYLLKLLLGWTMVSFSLCLSAQSHDGAMGDTLSFFKRFSFHTNAMDWVLTTPNIGVEFNFSGAPTSHYSILVDGKYNWNTYHSVHPRMVYNLAAVRVEARKYWRTGGKWEGHAFARYSQYHEREKETIKLDNGKDTIIDKKTRGEVARDTTISSPRWAFQMLRRNVLSGRTFRNARMYRAYYVGMYAGYEKYTYSVGRGGIQGDSYNFGFSGGYSIPLYFFRNGHSLDLDLGLALGLKMMEYDRFNYEEETGCYVYTETKTRHFLPYPVLQDIRIGFVFRFRSIKEKVQGGAERYEKWENEVYEPRRRKREKRREDNWYTRDSVRKEREKFLKNERLKRDALRDDRIRSKNNRKTDKQKGEEKEEAAFFPYSGMLPNRQGLWSEEQKEYTYYIKGKKGGWS